VLCRTRSARMGFVQFGAFRVLVCEACSKPLWHSMGLLDWLRGSGLV
jgi:hypothetical protein